MSEMSEDPKDGETPEAPAPSAEPLAPADAPPALAADSKVATTELESVLPADVPRIHLPIFDGPLDLLLYLIRKDKVDIHDIPIAPITRQYMEYLDVMKELNLELAGEFMVMAATLIHIKSKMLVPIEPTEAENDEEYVDPRDELVQRLLEFQRYKEAAGLLHQKREIRAATWMRPESAVPKFDDAGEEMIEAGLFDLISAFKELLERRKVLIAHEVDSEGKTVEQRIEEILLLVKEGDSLDFMDLFESQKTKMDMIVTFLAVLELIRLKRVKVYQRGNFGPIRIFRPVGPTEAGAPAPVV
jgi:segregation and condensation protein A